MSSLFEPLASLEIECWTDAYFARMLSCDDVHKL